LAKAGIAAHDARFQQMMDAVDALLQTQAQGHGQAMDIAGHNLDVAGHNLAVQQAMNPPAPTGPAGGGQ
jgi:hypothetical protein